MAMYRNVKEIVFNNLNRALENGEFERGGDLYGRDASYIADDLIMYAADCADIPKHSLTKHVIEWLKVQGKIG